MTPAVIPKDVLRNPTIAAALPIYDRWRRANGRPLPADASVEVTAMACIHKAQLAWSGSIKHMVRESRAWLVEHGMAPALGSTIPRTVE